MKEKLKELMKTFTFALVLIVIAFCVAAITKLKETEKENSDDSVITTKTTSLIDSIIPTTKSNTDSVSEIEKIFSSNGDEVLESAPTRYLFNRYMKDFSYTYRDDIKMYSYDNLFIIYYDDGSGIVKIFLFNKSTNNHIKTIKTVKPISDAYLISFKIIDSKLYYIEEITERNDECLEISSLNIKYFDLIDHEESVYKETKLNDNIKIICNNNL